MQPTTSGKQVINLEKLLVNHFGNMSFRFWEKPIIDLRNNCYPFWKFQGPELAIRMADIRDVTDGIGKLRKSYNYRK